MNRTRALSLRRAATGVAVVLASMIVATSPALASSIADGTSNTIQFAVFSAGLDHAHHRVVVTGPVPGALTPGKRLATAKLVTPRSTVILTDVLVRHDREVRDRPHGRQVDVHPAPAVARRFRRRLQRAFVIRGDPLRERRLEGRTAAGSRFRGSRRGQCRNA